MTKLLDLWQPPTEDRAVGCFATSFTFDVDFFASDCLSRFLGISRVAGEGDIHTDVSRMLEEADRLHEAQVSVLVDRSCVPDKRDLRWDLLAVALPRGSLLHAKVAVLLWERHTRLLIGSANLTAAGYRRQVETMISIDIDENCGVPRNVLDTFATELRGLLGLVPGGDAGPKTRASSVIDLLDQRVDQLDPSRSRDRSVRLAVAATGPGVRPLSRRNLVWSGGPPRRLTALSPFWDDDAAARTALANELARRGPVDLKFVTAIDPLTRAVRAPRSILEGIPKRMAASLWGLGPVGDTTDIDSQLRGLHAKCILYESDTWIAGLIGSSNVTAPGLGIAGKAHRELNLWIGCPAASAAAESLRALIPLGDEIPVADVVWEEQIDEDETAPPALPLAFEDALLDPSEPPSLILKLAPTLLPDEWSITDGDDMLVDRLIWIEQGSPADLRVTVASGALISVVTVGWTDSGSWLTAPWPVNVTDPAQLPAPDQLGDISIEILLAVLASRRPIYDALEHELRRNAEPGRGADELDALRRFDAGSLLLTRTRHISLALWGLRQRLSQPIASVEALDWRLSGVVGATKLADGFVHSVLEGVITPHEARFHLAELARTVSGIDWKIDEGTVTAEEVRDRVASVVGHIRDALRLIGEDAGAVGRYVNAAMRSTR